jgi:FkbM family methyltransferase
VQAGIARGARWTLLPHSAYWRCGGESDVQTAMHSLGSIVGKSCWDLGAHFGIHTIGLAMAVGPNGEVAAFEPDPISHRRCALHIKMNRLTNVRLFEGGAGDTTGHQQLLVTGGLGTTSNHLRYEDEPISKNDRTIIIETLVLDELVANGRIRPPMFVKIDVEGYGAKAVRGALKTFAQYRPVMVMSFHSHFEADDTQALLGPIGYHCYDNDGRRLAWSAAVFRTVVLKS